jgi:phosphatidylserine decarboxylase
MTEPDIQRTRIENRLSVAREGLPFIIPGLIVTILLFFLSIFFAGIILGIISIFVMYFFRDPNRSCDAGEDTVLSPADGTIVDIRHLESNNNRMGAPALKISIFMSVFNVHVNRIPAKGKVSGIVYNPGRFFSANLDKASEQNEKNSVTLNTDSGHKVVVVQIAGLIARRIVCWVKAGDEVAAGQRFGLIRFGSRVDIYLPGDSHVTARLKDRVKAGESVIGYLP